MKYYRIVYRQGMGKVGAEISRVGSGVRYRKRKTQGNILVLWCKIRKLGGITTMSKWEIMQRVADTRKEIETFAQDWADVPGGTRNPLAVADWERLWRQLDELFAALQGCAVA